MTNAAEQRQPATSGTTTSGAPQPARGWRMSANTGPASPSAHSAAPSDVQARGPRLASAGAARRCAR